MRSDNMKHKGFALLYALLVASLVLSVSMALTNVVLRQFTIESAARESQYAFYAADTAAECAFYWDARWQDHQGGNPFMPIFSDSPFSSYTSYFNSLPAGVVIGPVYCNGVIVTINRPVAGLTSTHATSTFVLNNLPNGRIASTSIGKTSDLTTHNVTAKYIESYGYNTNVANSSRLVGRTIYGPMQ